MDDVVTQAPECGGWTPAGNQRTGRMTAESMIAGREAGTTRSVKPLIDILIEARPDDYIDLHFIPKMFA